MTKEEKFNLAIAIRWHEEQPKTTHCIYHNTRFNPGEEPCWQCWKEFDMEADEDKDGRTI